MKNYNKNNSGFGLIETLIIALLVIILGLASWYVYSHRKKNPSSASENQSITTKPLMTVSYVGGLCSNNKVCSSKYNLFDDGSFQQHKKLSALEVAQLKETINKTDFLNYQQNSKPNCPSYVDGSDEILAFPQKYPGKSFKLCELQIPTNDTSINFINGLIKTHQHE